MWKWWISYYSHTGSRKQTLTLVVAGSPGWEREIWLNEVFSSLEAFGLSSVAEGACAIISIL